MTNSDPAEASSLDADNKIPAVAVFEGDTKGLNRSHAENDTPSSSPPTQPRPPPPLENVSILSKWSFTWPLPTLLRGMQRPLEDEDLPELLLEDSSAFNREYMERLWMNEQQRAKHERERRKRRKSFNGLLCLSKLRDIFYPAKRSLYHAIIKDYFKSIWFAQVLLVVSMAARLGQSLALGLLIEQFTPAEENQVSNAKMGYVWASTIIGCGIVFLVCKQMQFFITHRKGFTMQFGLVAAIYSKALRLNSIGTPMQISSGQIINLASNDVERYVTASVLLLYFIWAPVEALAILATGVATVGGAFAAGFGLLLAFIPLQLYLSRQFATLRSKVAAITDARVNLVGQAVQGIRITKYNAWEPSFSSRIQQHRSAEMDKIIRASRYKSLNEAIGFATTVTVSVVTFSVHVWAGGVLTSRKVFTAMSLINLLQISMTRIFSNVVMYLSECYVSSRRIQDFLEAPEITPSCVNTDGTEALSTPEGKPCIKLSNVTCYWDSERESKKLQKKNKYDDCDEEEIDIRAALFDINLELFSGNLYCIIGPVGGGKSALLQALAGELPCTSGKMSANHNNANDRYISYAQQDPFIHDGSVRENILFGLPFREDWYLQVISSCGLTTDLEQFPNRDATIVGDRGVQCSGGQRARIGLARAIYRDADVVLLDDPLSAVDAKVGRLIFYHAIKELCVDRGKLVVLATHQHQFIGDSTCFLMMDGRIKCNGSYSACVTASEGKLATSFQTAEGDGPQNQNHVDSEKRNMESIRSSEHNNNAVSRQANDSKSTGVVEEDRNTGIIQMSTWKEYLTAMGGIPIGIFLFLLYCTTQSLNLVTIVYFGEWAEQPASQQNTGKWIGLVYGLVISVVILALARTRCSYYFCLKASQRLHDVAIGAVLRSKIEFFDTTPLGRILNRFSADVGIADDQLPLSLVDFLVGCFLALGSVVTAVVTLPMTLLALPPLLWYFIRLRGIFVTTSRELKRLEGLARSPIYALVGEALSGVATMRANDAISYFQSKFQDVHNQYGRAYFMFVASSRWFATRMDFIAFVFVAITSVLAVLFHQQQWLDVQPAVIGMCLTLLLQMAGTNFPWMVRQSAEVVNQMVSIERVSAFGHLPSEAPLTTSFDDELDKCWPVNPSIVTSDLTVRYREHLPPALSGVSFQVEAGQRIGVCGRTGSGKSTLVQALFRLLEAEEGKITIDGINISQLGLHKLRQVMSVIPQSPVLFAGTSVRFNLDPFDKYDNETIFEALANAQILDLVRDLPNGIDTIVAESGSNFSVGQRQLLCLARAILRKSKILVLDESSANIDHQTDILLQEAVRKSFSGATILSVAHRLGSIIDHDRVLVLGHGKVLEFGSPKELLERDGSHFASMVESTGEQMAKSLRAQAQENRRSTNK